MTRLSSQRYHSITVSSYVDGVIVRGASDLDESTITGESTPVARQVGDQVYAGSLNGTGSLEVEVTKPAKDSTLAWIIQLVENAQASKARTQRFLEAFLSAARAGDPAGR